MEKGKNRLARCAELHAIFLAVMEKLNSGESPYVWVFTVSWAVASGLARLKDKGNMITGVSIWDTAYGNHCENLRGPLK